MATATFLRHSAKVRLSLHVAGQIFPLSHVGRDECILRSPAKLEPQSAEIVAEIDDERQVNRVYLPHGASADSCRVAIKDVDR
jgi:hypothetical protein